MSRTEPTASSASTTCVITLRSSLGPVQRGPHYAIVDEVDNILIDEARTPLIISGEARSRRRCTVPSRVWPRPPPETDFTIDEQGSYRS